MGGWGETVDYALGTQEHQQIRQFAPVWLLNCDAGFGFPVRSAGSARETPTLDLRGRPQPWTHQGYPNPGPTRETPTLDPPTMDPPGRPQPWTCQGDPSPGPTRETLTLDPPGRPSPWTHQGDPHPGPTRETLTLVGPG